VEVVGRREERRRLKNEARASARARARVFPLLSFSFLPIKSTAFCSSILPRFVFLRVSFSYNRGEREREWEGERVLTKQ